MPAHVGLGTNWSYKPSGAIEVRPVGECPIVVHNGETLFFRNSDRSFTQPVTSFTVSVYDDHVIVELEGWHLYELASNGTSIYPSISWKDGDPHIKAYRLDPDESVVLNGMRLPPSKHVYIDNYGGGDVVTPEVGYALSMKADQ